MDGICLGCVDEDSFAAEWMKGEARRKVESRKQKAEKGDVGGDAGSFLPRNERNKRKKERRRKVESGNSGRVWPRISWMTRRGLVTADGGGNWGRDGVGDLRVY